MLISDLITLLKRGVLKQVSVDDAEVISFINQAMIEVYKKFDLNVKEQVLILDSDINEYRLSPDLMIVNSVYTQKKFLKDYQGNLLTTDGSDEPIELALNDAVDLNSVFTPTPGVILVPFPTTGQSLSVIYRAAPREITEDDLESNLLLGSQYLQPITLYVAYLSMLSMDSTGQNGNDNLFLKFEQACANIDQLGLNQSEQSNNSKLDRRGYA